MSRVHFSATQVADIRIDVQQLKPFALFGNTIRTIRKREGGARAHEVETEQLHARMITYRPMPTIRATAILTQRGSFGQFITNRIVPALRAAVETAGKGVLEEAQRIVPVDTGELRDSGYVNVRETDKTVVADVGFSADHAGYVEYGTGRAGAASAGAGPYPYSPTWPGMPARPYLRPALDTMRDTIREEMASQIALAMRQS